MKTSFKILLCGSLILVGHPTHTRAQDATPAPTGLPPAEQPLNSPATSNTETLAPEALILNQIERDLKDKYKKEIYIPPAIQSLIYSPDQQSLLREARAGFNTRVPVEEENTTTGTDPGKSLPVASSQQLAVRALSLGGIVFTNSKDWTIWLNKKLVTAATIPTQAVDLRVYKDFIEIRWFDVRTNKIFPIRLRPNQTFNLDGQTFIPG